MAKVPITITIDEDVKDAVETLRSTKVEDRNLSAMIEKLVKEALDARGIKIKTKKK